MCKQGTPYSSFQSKLSRSCIHCCFRSLHKRYAPKNVIYISSIQLVKCIIIFVCSNLLEIRGILKYTTSSDVIFSVSLHEKRKNPIDLLIDEIDVDSYLFHKFLDVFIVQDRVIRLSKGLFRENYLIKEFFFELSFEHQSFKLTAELHLTRKEI